MEITHFSALDSFLGGHTWIRIFTISISSRRLSPCGNEAPVRVGAIQKLASRASSSAGVPCSHFWRVS
jgi:hypothetical protein